MSGLQVAHTGPKRQSWLWLPGGSDRRQLEAPSGLSNGRSVVCLWASGPLSVNAAAFKVKDGYLCQVYPYRVETVWLNDLKAARFTPVAQAALARPDFFATFIESLWMLRESQWLTPFVIDEDFVKAETNQLERVQGAVEESWWPAYRDLCENMPAGEAVTLIRLHPDLVDDRELRMAVKALHSNVEFKRLVRSARSILA